MPIVDGSAADTSAGGVGRTIGNTKLRTGNVVAVEIELLERLKLPNRVWQGFQRIAAHVELLERLEIAGCRRQLGEAKGVDSELGELRKALDANCKY